MVEDTRGTAYDRIYPRIAAARRALDFLSKRRALPHSLRREGGAYIFFFFLEAKGGIVLIDGR